MNFRSKTAAILGICLASLGSSALANNHAALVNHTENSWAITPHVTNSDSSAKVLLVPEGKEDVAEKLPPFDFSDPAGRPVIVESKKGVIFYVVSAKGGLRNSVWFDIVELSGKAGGGVEGMLHLSYDWPSDPDQAGFDGQLKLRGQFWNGLDYCNKYLFSIYDTTNINLMPNSIMGCAEMCVIL